MSQQGREYIAQAAAIPFRRDPDTGRLEVLLIRRRDGGKWGIPKGLVDPGLTHRQAAAVEALEEAGVRGVIGPGAVGTFTYDKFGGTCLVRVYAMRVTSELPHWDEEALRARQWFDAEEARRRVGRASVARLIGQFAESAAAAGR